jgi:hypothetical protein
MSATRAARPGHGRVLAAGRFHLGRHGQRPAQVFGQVRVDLLPEGLRVDGLGQVVVETGAQCSVAVADHGERGHRDDRDVGETG